MPYAVLILSAIGHAILWVALVNRLHGYAINRMLMDGLTAVCAVAVTAIPIVVLTAVLRAEALSDAAGQPAGLVLRASWAYLAVCAAISVIGTAAWLWTVVHPERRVRLCRITRRALT